MLYSSVNSWFRRNVWIAGVILIAISLECWSFVPPLSHWKYTRSTNNQGNSGSNSGGNGPPPSYHSLGGHSDNGDENFSNINLLGGSIIASAEEEKNGDAKTNNKATSTAQVEEDTLLLRGGSSKKKDTGALVAGSKTTFSKTVTYWSKACKSATETLAKPFRFVSSKVDSIFSRMSKEEKAAAESMAALQATPVQAVTVPNSTVLPPEVVSIAAKRSGLIGKPLRHEELQSMAQALKQWYIRKGYVLHSVTGATLREETATAEIEVEEPVVSEYPVGITYCKEMVIDDETGNLLTYRQYKGRHAKRKTVGHNQIKKSDLNTTFVTTDGRTNPKRIARALQLTPGKPFQWDGSRWQSVMSSGIFGKILQANPQRMNDGTVQFHVVATERAPRNLEYGITKSLYTGSWEGELDFKNANLFGGGEVVGLEIRRGTRDAEPSVKVSFNDDKFGQAGGYACEVFSDFIGEDDDDGRREDKEDVATDYEHDSLLCRKGATMRVQNPIDQNSIHHSFASASLERTSTRAGHHEKLGSATLGVGPFRKVLPFEARSSIKGSITSGARIPEVHSTDGESSSNSFSLLPYASGTATTRQVFPFMADQADRPVALAMSHTAMTSTHNFPHHEAISAGVAAQIRGYPTRSNGPITSSLKGTTEIRVPVKLPSNKVRQDASVVTYADWLFAKSARHGDSLVRKSSVGVGIRKSFQGIPIKYDVSYTRDGKVSAYCTIGQDFDA